MNAPCGCCEGTEVLTPQRVTNQPGLSSLVYRIGTHATFLETMKARLSVAEFAELGRLTTRDASDPAIAWLDAWATVADVLTFYQERIANEGYLRTATERRSILELARLVGYALRPGVAASVHLAYTLEEKQRVEIPAGAQAQSVPGPGELPETFETSDTVATRAEWNTLQLRLTRPINPAQAAVEGSPLYFKGTETNLKPNDLLLIDADRQVPLRVMEVTPDQAAGRTKVTHQFWTEGPEDLARRKLERKARHMRETLARFSRTQDFEVDASTATATEVLELLSVASTKIRSAKSDAELRSALDDLRAKLPDAKRFSRLGPWIGDIIAEVNELESELEETTGDDRDVLTFPDRTPFDDISQLVGDLEKPASRPPANSQELSRSISTSFSATSDALPKLLVTMRPALRDNLYRAWTNLPVTQRAEARVYALRTRASVFGHNAPLKLVTDPRTGRVTGTEEWTLFRTRDGEPVKEHFQIVITKLSIGGIRIDIEITQASGPKSGEASDQLSTRPVSFDMRIETIEVVRVTASGGVPPADPEKLEFEFTQRGFVVIAEHSDSGWSVDKKITDPTRVAVNNLSRKENGLLKIVGDLELGERIPTEEPKKVSLDASYKEVLPESWAVLEKPPKGGKPDLLITRVNHVREHSRADYGISGSGTQLELNDAWIDPANDSFAVIRATTVFAQSELLELAEAPIDPVAESLCGDRVELADLFDGLESGRWLIVSGERTDITHPPPSRESVREILPGVTSSELVMLGGVEQGYDPGLPGDRTHTTLLLSPGLAYCYKRDTVTIYGNVIEATHGETRNEVLGSGDGSKALQEFELHQSPVTYVAAPTPAGVESTLEVRVNEVQWQESPSLDVLKPADRKFITRTDDKDQMTVTFGNGVHGARLPTGVENVRAVYRTGIGKPGNVKAGQITTPLTRPLGVQKVTNPRRATGGADRESRDAARRNAPLAVMALDRLVATRDYEDFARTFAGIGKASAARLSNGQQQLVHVTIAGAGDIPIDDNSKLYRSLVQALNKFGDPFQAVQVAIRELMLLVVSARVKVLPEYRFESVATNIRAVLLETFGFDRRELGQSVFLSELISAIQNVAGVAYADLDVLESVSESEILSPDELKEKLNELVSKASLPGSRPRQLIQVRKAAPKSQAKCGDVTKTGICPAQLAFLSPDVPETLILTELSA